MFISLTLRVHKVLGARFWHFWEPLANPQNLGPSFFGSFNLVLPCAWGGMRLENENVEIMRSFQRPQWIPVSCPINNFVWLGDKSIGREGLTNSIINPGYTSLIGQGQQNIRRSFWSIFLGLSLPPPIKSKLTQITKVHIKVCRQGCLKLLMTWW